MEIKVLKNVMIKNNTVGADIRRMLAERKIYSVNFVSSPGAGKTTLLQNSLKSFIRKYKTAVIEGDLYTSRDAEKLQDLDIPIVQINTEGGCHLDARMISGALNELPIDKLDFVVIENVGNLVCPSSFDLGENLRVLVYSITEGEDKPKKYATMFKTANVVIINKVDLADACKVDLKVIEKEVKEAAPNAVVFKLSANNEKTLAEWNAFLDVKISELKKS
ncbi:MAG: hydrogenase nickel incorporation protein HypB [Pseudomonadota bacterium]